MDILELISSVLLLAVTIIYVVFTGRMAKSTAETVASAERSAKAAELAAAATMASVDVAFDVRPSASYVFEPTQVCLNVTVWCTGATVYVHSGHLMHAAYQYQPSDTPTPHYKYITTGTDLEVFNGPERLHRGEHILLRPASQLVLDYPGRVARLQARVNYSLSKDGELLSKICYWEGKENVDFTPIPEVSPSVN